MVTITKITENKFALETGEETLKKIKKYFSYVEKGAEFSKAYKFGYWDGRKYLIGKDNTFFAGILDRVLRYCEANKLPYKIYGVSTAVEPDSIALDWLCGRSITKGGSEVKLWPHQSKAFIEGVTRKNRVIISPTSSGKTMVLYLYIRYFEENLDPKKKILVIVPNLSLFEQTLADFKDYSSTDPNWSVEKNIHSIMAGEEKFSRKNIYFSTWQSLKNMEPEYFEKFGAVLVDETHLASADVLYNILSYCSEATYRIGMTGTLSKNVGDNFRIESVLGPTSQFITTRELIDAEMAAELNIHMLELCYNKETVKKLKRKSYIYEVENVLKDENRNKFLLELCSHLKGNTMILFNYVSKHGIPLHENLKKAFPERNIYYISGMIDSEEREKIRLQMEKEENAILVANFATSSTGVSITNLKNLVIASSVKSNIRIIQTIGRGLRRGAEKTKINVYDIVDDLRTGKYVNHLYRHGEERKNIYQNENYDFKVNKISI